MRESGALSERRLEVYDALFRHGPGTSAEIIVHLLAGEPAVRTLTQNRARFTELRDSASPFERPVSRGDIPFAEELVERQAR